MNQDTPKNITVAQDQFDELMTLVREVHTRMFGDKNTQTIGIVEMVEGHDSVLHGDRKRGTDGLVAEVRNLKTFKTWIYCTVSAGFGVFLEIIIRGIIQH